MAFVLLAACGDGPADPPATPTALPTIAPTATRVLPAGDLEASLETVIIACREKNGGLLREFVAGEVSDDELVALFERGSGVRLLARTVPVPDAGRATVAVRLEITRASGIEVVDRSWELEQGEDGVWRLTELPDCF